MKTFVIAAVFAIVAAAEANAAARSFSQPKANGAPISDCLADGVACGKAAADAFCKREGFNESIMFQREPAVFAQILDSEELCTTSGACRAFTRIKCYTEQPQDQASN